MQASKSLSIRRSITALVLSVILITAYLLRDAITEWPTQSLYVASTVIGIAAIVAVGVSGRLKLWSGGFFLILIIVLFHVGLPLVFTMGWDIPVRYQGYLDLWLDSTASVNIAVWLCIVSMLAFTLGYMLFSWRRDASTPFGTTTNGAGLAVGGLSLTLAGTVLYLGYIAINVPSLLLGFGGKRMYEATVAGSEAIAYGTIIVSIGSVLAAAAPKGRARTAALTVFFIFTAITLALGSRTAALYALVAVIVVIARVRKMPSQRVAIVTVLIGLMVVSGVQQTRDDGLSKADLSQFVGSPAAAAAEMGLTLRPVVETVNWVEGGEPLRYGTTYLAGMQRLFESAVGLPRPDSVEDQRFAGYLVRERVALYQIGFSIVAEAYLNFGTYGTGLFFLILGAALGRWDSVRLGDATSAARYGVVFVALIAHVRQASNITLTGILLGLLAVEVSRRAGSVIPTLQPTREHENARR